MDRSSELVPKDENAQEQRNDASALVDLRSLDIDERDGQRRSLSMDEDGGTHFENSDSLDTVIRRGGLIRDGTGCATFMDAFEDNDIMFNPAQRLNFDDEYDEEEEEKMEGGEEDGNKRSDAFEEEEDLQREEDDSDENSDKEDDNDEIALVVQSETNEPEDGSDYLHNRPWVSGSDLVEDSLPTAIDLGQSQSQNVRIIEGHDSSLLDDGNPGGPAVYGYNFLQPQLGPLSPMSLPHSATTGSDSEAHNMYDSLERETVSDPYGAVGEDAGDTSTSEYYSLMATNSNGNISDSFWQQGDVSSLQRNQTTIPSSSHTLNQNIPMMMGGDSSREQNPPRNFQLDHVHMSSGVSDNQAFVVDGNVNAPYTLPDQLDALNMELSEEGLSQNTQMYAQPLSNASTVELAAVGGMSSSERGDDGSMSRQIVLDTRIYSSSGHKQPNTDYSMSAGGGGISFNARVNNSQPKNLAQSKPGGKPDVTGASIYPEVKVTDMNTDRRQAGAGSSNSFIDKIQSAAKGNKTRSSGAIAKKAQIRRPAVQGSASAGDQKRSSSLASSQSVSAILPANVAVAGKAMTMSSRANTQVGSAGPQGSKQKQAPTASEPRQPTTSATSGQHPAQVKHNYGGSPLASRTNSHSSLASVGSSNSRVGGVGKESHHYQGQGGPSLNTPTQQSTDSQSSHPGPPHRIDHNGQVKHSAMHFNPPPTSHPLAAAPPHHAMYPSMQSQRNQYQMQELHADGPRSYPYPYPYPNPHNTGFAPQPNNYGHGVQQHPHAHAMAGNSLTNVQNQQMGSFPYQAAMSPSGSESSHHSYNREAVVTQMDTLKKGMLTQSGLGGNEMCNGGSELQSIEDVRSHLHSMLHIGVDHSNADFSGLEQMESASELLTDQPVNRQLHFDTNDSSSMFGNKAGDDMSEILENFPAFSSKLFSDVSGPTSRSETHMQSEIQYLREGLEKERYRRKHCEDQIQRLNSKLLEIQQQLAVAVSTDKRKDTMIEQLDKQLAKVVEGWKKREADKDEALKTLTEEKGRIEDSLQRQQAMINNFERDLAQTVDELKDERTKSSETIQGLRKQLTETSSDKEKAEEGLLVATSKCDSMTEEWESMKSSQEIWEMRAQQAQEKLTKEQDAWAKREHELSDKITQVKEANQKVISMEKVKLEEHKKKREAAESDVQELKAELKRLVLDTEQLVREKESQKMEVSIMEAKNESAHRKLEADLHTQMEKEIADQASEFHTRLENAMDEANERHRNQVSEIHRRHQKDMERQMAVANEEREKKDDDHKTQISDLESRLQDTRTENSNLKQSKLKLESQRMEILSKLQFMMQSQWNEAVSLLVSTPQKRNVQSSFLSSSGGLQLSSSSGAAAATMASMALSQASVPSMLKTKMPDYQTSDNGRKSSTSSTGGERSSTEEALQLDKVEKYLQRLNVQPDGPLSGDDGQTPETGLHVSMNTHTVHENTVTQSYRQHPIPGESPNRNQHAFTETTNNAQIKLSHSPSHPSSHHQKHIPRQLNGNQSSPPPSSAHVSMSHDFQAVPIRSPQQMSRLSPQQMTRLTQGSDNGTMSSREEGPRQFFRSSDLPLKSNPPPPPHPHQAANGRPNTHLHSHYTALVHQLQHQHQQGRENFFFQYNDPLVSRCNAPKSFSPEHNNVDHRAAWEEPSSRPMPTPAPSALTHVSGDSGDQALHSHHQSPDHADHIAHNRNLFNSSSSAFTSSSPSSGVTPISSSTVAESGKEHSWSPDHAVILPKMFMSQTSPDRNQRQRRSSYTYNLDSPVKSQSRESKRTGNFNTSLSPPVKQTAERDQTYAHSEATNGMPDHHRLDADYSHLSDRLEKPLSRHEELQHYIQLLLQKAPGSVAVQAERDVPHDLDILESSRDLTVDLDLNDTAQAQELTSQLNRLQQLREGQQTNAPDLTTTHQSYGNRPPQHLAEYIGDNGVMNAQGLSEISQLLSLYREQWEANPEMAKQVNTAGQLIEALKGVGVTDMSFESAPRNDLQKQTVTKVSPRDGMHKKPRDVSSGNKTKKKPANLAADVSIATTVDSLDRSHNSGKGGNNVPATGVAVAVTTARKNQEAVKESRKVNGTGTGVVKQTTKGGPVWK